MPGQPVVLETLGGLVCTARPEDIPEGASPRTYDTDFIVGRVIQRAGQQSVYSYSGNVFGPKRPTTAISVGSNPWINPINITTGATTGSTVMAQQTTAILQTGAYNFTIPSSITPTGIVLTMKGIASTAILSAQLLKAGISVGEVKTIVMPQGTSQTFTLGSPTDTWGVDWLFSDIDATNFDVNIWATAGAAIQTIGLIEAQITIYGTEGGSNYNGLLSVDLDSTDQTTLALDSEGLTWQENVATAQGVLSRATLVPAVVPGSYMKGVDADGIAYMAYSDLTQGTSQPMQFNGDWCDRITQVGPGQAPTFTPQQARGDSFNIATITQPPAQSDDTDPGHISALLWSAGPGTTAAGNVITVYYSPSFGAPAAEDKLLDNAFNSGQVVIVYLSGLPFGNGVYQVTSVGNNLPPGLDHGRWFFTVQASTSNFQQATEAAGQYQMSVATMTTTAPVPGLVVGNQVTITGSTPSAWNAVWTITQTLNSGSMSITETSVSAGVATYDYTLISGVGPTSGQLVTITGTLNANGALNGANLVIATSTGGPSGSFTIAVSVPDATGVSEAAQATTAGTEFQFDPGTADLGTTTSPIFGNGTGGSLTFSVAAATFITPGVKQGSCFWVTRNGAVTQPANPVTFTVPNNTQTIAATLIPVGPPNVAFVGITFTESGQNNVPGASFYTYDTPVKYTINGITYIASSLIVPNGTTSAIFQFPDSVLLASDEIDVQGNNYFNLMELGSPTWIFQYAERMLYGLCQTKVHNLINMSFDGGYLPGPSPLPLGWSSAGNFANVPVGLVVSPDFGNTLQVLNSSGEALDNAYILYQSAYQDFYGVNIVQPNTAYSIRLKGRALNADGQKVTIAMVPVASGTAFGSQFSSATFTLKQGNFTIQSAPVFPATATIVPTMQIAIQINSLGAGAGFQIDRIELYPTERPVDTTTIWTSYAGKFESVDIVTGQLGCGDDNAQPAQGAYQILENLYIEKTASRCVTQDSPNYEPDQWNVPLSSQGSGSVGPNAFYAEEEFSISASRPGLFLFDGGKPMPISRELQSTGTGSSIWEMVNWNAAKSIWVRFSTDKRQLFVAVPMRTPNFFLPNAPNVVSPASPNVILMCNFTGCPTAAELAESMPVHTTMFGDLKALDMRRKWSIWQIASPVAEFITRQDGFSRPLFLGNGTGTSKIYQFVDGAATGGQNTDDGAPINWLYTTYGFIKAKQGQQIQGLGAIRKVWYYFTATMEGVGQVARKFYSNTLANKPINTFQAPNASLNSPQFNDQECVLEIGGQRLFIEFSAVGSAGYAEIGPVMLDGEVDKNSPHRGVSS